MRVVAGKYRHRSLKTLEAFSTRPTLDRVKESMFNILQLKLCNASVLDLFSGSGALGIEALSRGANKVVFNDLNKKAYQIILDNLNTLDIQKDCYEIFQKNYEELLSILSNKKFDLILLDPPFDKFDEVKIIFQLLQYQLLQDNAWIIIESGLNKSFKDLAFFETKEYRYGEVKVSILKYQK